MRRLRLEAAFTIFLLFFGTAMVDALRHHRWLLSAVYIALALSFLFAGGAKRVHRTNAP